LVDVLNKRYKDVTAALSRIEDGTYGICSISGKEIESERLDADPAATTCIEFVSKS
jgi:RNA polymerase-binding transcription factor DksA